MEEREYIIILRDFNDLDQFYEDMESRYGDNEIPSRVVECAYRRPSSRSTHYYLTDQEALEVAKDSRVQAIELNYRDKGVNISPLSGSQYSDGWDKSGTNNPNHVNWGLYRGFTRNPVSNWGADGTPSVSGQINLLQIGRNVDVVIIDGHMVAGHPEWAVNADGTGGTRLYRYNWFSHNQVVRGIDTTEYKYDFPAGTDGDHDHGNNVGAIAAGNTCGWARGANIYNICPYGSTSNATGYSNYGYDIINYVREWHRNKPINSITGRKNPTICNMSYGFNIGVFINSSFRIYFQGAEFIKPKSGWTISDRIKFGLLTGDAFSANPTAFFQIRDESIDADVADAVADGIIMVGAAGNFYGYNDVPGGLNYNNALSKSFFGGIANIPGYFYCRGPSPSCAPGAISVSAVDHTVLERKPEFSNAGPRTDIFSPGSNIMGAGYTSGVPDPRNSSFKKFKSGGTSQASPQVTGVIACALELNPSMTPVQAREYIRSIATADQLYDQSFNTTIPNDWFKQNSLYGGPNLYLAYPRDTTLERATQGAVHPKYNYRSRGASGQCWPRVKAYTRR